MSNEIILDLLKEVRMEQKDHSKSLNNMEKDICRNADDLKDHMKRTDILEKLHKDNQDRIRVLEKPSIARMYIVKSFLVIGSVASAIIVIAKVIGLF